MRTAGLPTFRKLYAKIPAQEWEDASVHLPARVARRGHWSEAVPSPLSPLPTLLSF